MNTYDWTTSFAAIREVFNSDGGFNSNDEDIDVFPHDCSHRSVFDPGLPGSTAFYGRPA